MLTEPGLLLLKRKGKLRSRKKFHRPMMGPVHEGVITRATLMLDLAHPFQIQMQRNEVSVGCHSVDDDRAAVVAASATVIEHVTHATKRLHPHNSVRFGQRSLLTR